MQPLPDTIVDLKDATGNVLIVVADKITHVMPAGDAHAEVYLIGGTYVRVRGTPAELVERIWGRAPLPA